MPGQVLSPLRIGLCQNKIWERQCSRCVMFHVVQGSSGEGREGGEERGRKGGAGANQMERSVMETAMEKEVGEC